MAQTKTTTKKSPTVKKTTVKAPVKKISFFSKKIFGASLGGAFIIFFAGIIFWGGFNTSMEATNTMGFCIGCHEMEDNVYQEYKPTIHYSNRTGVRATCSDCHVPDPWIHKVVRKIQASKEVWHKVLGTIDNKEKFDNHRLTMAKSVWNTMKETDSRECRNCHNFESMNPKFQIPRARKQHLSALETGATCIDCHKGIAHKDVRKLLTDEEIEELEKPNPAFVRKVPQSYLDGMAEITEIEKSKKAADLAKQEENEASIQQQIDEAVKEALESAKSAAAAVVDAVAPPVEAAPAPSSGGKSFSVSWGKAKARIINLLYPGQTSMEWMLNGKDHSGNRAFDKGGERCFDCHDNEIDIMGKKIVTGEKAEPTPIKGKRGHIPVTVKSMFDDKYLYMQFSWKDGKKSGKKMDPKNQIKLAIMFANDEVKWADQAGCWGTCHHDLVGMPDEANKNAHKYIKESRTKIEIKGKNGKKRGGWDKKKSKGDIATALKSGKFMDIVRFNSGGDTEDGYVLDDRIMKGGQGVDFVGTKKGNKWVVQMRRLLKSSKAGDVSFDIKKMYNFGFAIHDDYTNARFHHVSLGYKLGFNNKKAEVNAVKK
ncbi:MAG: cytochrome C552 [Gammaproteobacteria bacterium]|nr:MAG: cytochrome C552 [Gammaproteobacteria bacterium]